MTEPVVDRLEVVEVDVHERGAQVVAAGAREGAAAMLHRLAAALGLGTAPTRSDSTVTPDPSAASISHRVAVRSNPGAGP